MHLLPVIIPLALVPVIVVVLVLGLRVRKRRTEAIHTAAATLGLAFEETRPVDEIKARADLPLFAHGHTRRASNVITGRFHDREVLVFDYQYTQGAGQHQHVSRQTVALFPGAAQRIPDFALSPENVFHKIGQAFGYQDIDFDTNPVFSSHYLLRGPDDYAVRAAFSPDTLAFFEQHQGWHVEVRGGSAAIYRARKRSAPEDLATFLEETSAVLRALVHA